jgi:aminoglycoside 3-N-acetyltransferase I
MIGRYEVVRLGPDDLTAAREAQRLYAEVFEDRETYLGAPAGDGYLAELLGAAGNVLLVAMDAGRVVGALTAYELRKFEQARSEFYIYDLAVAEAHRRRGLATALIAEVQGIALAAGGWVVFVQADHGDKPAIALYSRLGTREEVLHFDLPV